MVYRWNQTALDGAKYFQKHEKDKIKLDEYNKLIIMLEPVTETNKTPQNKHGNLESSSDNKSATKDDSLIPASHDKELKVSIKYPNCKISIKCINLII